MPRRSLTWAKPELVQAERRAKKNLLFLSYAEAQPDLGEARVSASREKGQEKLAFFELYRGAA